MISEAWVHERSHREHTIIKAKLSKELISCAHSLTGHEKGLYCALVYQFDVSQPSFSVDVQHQSHSTVRTHH